MQRPVQRVTEMKSALRRCALAIVLIPLSSVQAADNPMWRFGFDWGCTFQQVVTCERQQNCRESSASGSLSIGYRENRVVDSHGASLPMRRHYVQTVNGSPIAAEVKIELENNGVIWLNPVDSSGIYSNNWIGAMITPKGGVLLAEMKPLLCTPAR